MMKKRLLSRRHFLVYGSTLVSSACIRPIYTEKNNYDVIVIGAGLSGLQTTRLLEKQGVEVLLLEASRRVGGRVHTLDEMEGKPEVGGTQTGSLYHHLNNASAELGIEFSIDRAGAPGLSLSVSGELMDMTEWDKSPVNKVPEKIQSILPGSLLMNLLVKGEKLDDPLDWNQPAHQHLDIPLASHLKTLGADDEVLRLIDANLNGASIDTLSAVDVLRKISILTRAGAPRYIKNGSSRLPDAMAANLKNPVYFNKTVTRIHDTGHDTSVSCTDGSMYRAKYCVISAPYSVVRNLNIDARLTREKQLAINHLSYTQVTIVLMKPKLPYWEQDGYSANMWTDTPIGRVFTESAPDGRVIRQRAWITGPSATRIHHLSHEQIGEMVVDTMSKIRPASKDKLTVEKVIAWGRDPNARGAFSHYLAGDVQRFAHAINTPEGRLHFIGEHTAPGASGMEAAMESGSRGAEDILSQLTMGV